MSVLLKCAACGHEVPFADGDLETEAVCPGCEVLLRRRSDEDNMAIPVSMELPEAFGHADLKQMSKLSETLINRYQRSVPAYRLSADDEKVDGQLALARAIEKLADAVEGAGARVGKPALTQNSAHSIELSDESDFAFENQFFFEEDNAEAPFPEELETAVRLKNGNAQENGSTTGQNGRRANPVNAPVLVRREAAKEAHRFKRETQAHTDIKGVEKSSMALWIENHPGLMMFMGMSLLISLVVLTTVVMEKSFSDKIQPAANGRQLIRPDALVVDRNAAVEAEKCLRNFLAAPNADAARPYIYQASLIERKLDAYFEPFDEITDFLVKPLGVRKRDDLAVHFFQVEAGEVRTPFVVLQEDQRHRVLWEYTSGVGDLSWGDFVGKEPKEPTLVRVLVRPADVFGTPFRSENWTSWWAQDLRGEHQMLFFAPRSGPATLRMDSAFQNWPVKIDEVNWAMVQVEASHQGLIFAGDAGSFESAEVKEVPLGSWLPAEFEFENTFYTEKDAHQENPLQFLELDFSM